MYHISIHPIPIMPYSKCIISLFTPFPLCHIQNLSYPYSPHSHFAIFNICHIPFHLIPILPYSITDPIPNLLYFNFATSLFISFPFCHIPSSLYSLCIILQFHLIPILPYSIIIFTPISPYSLATMFLF